MRAEIVVGSWLYVYFGILGVASWLVRGAMVDAK
jgi:hypothetical protein